MGDNMLIKFTVENYKNFKEPITLDFTEIGCFFVLKKEYILHCLLKKRYIKKCKTYKAVLKTKVSLHGDPYYES